MPEPENHEPPDRAAANTDLAALLADDDLLLMFVASVQDQHDPPPDPLSSARVAWSTRAADAQLAELLLDSRAAAAGARAASSDSDDEWLASFAVDGVTIDLSARRADDGMRLLGQLHGHDGPVLVDVLDRSATAASAVACPIDAFGRFRAGPFRSSRIRVRAGADQGVIVTPWISL